MLHASAPAAPAAPAAVLAPPAALPGALLARLVALHLLPGAVGTALYVAVAPRLIPLGVPPLLTLILVLTPVVLLLELGHLLGVGRARTGRLSLAGVVRLDGGRLSGRRAALLALGMIAFSIVALVACAPLDGLLLRTGFAWLPGWAIRTDPAQYLAYGRPMLVLTFALLLALNGVALPLVEELYFRGYLLPRLAPLGRAAPAVNHGLFTLYHFWQPWQYLSILAFALPLAVVPWRTGDVRVAMVAHCSINLLGTALTAALILGAA